HRSQSVQMPIRICSDRPPSPNSCKDRCLSAFQNTRCGIAGGRAGPCTAAEYWIMIRLLSISAIASRALLALLAIPIAVPAHAAEPPLTELLDHVGHQMEKFWSYFASVTCTETVTQAKLGDRDKVLFAQHESFDYLIVLQSSGLDISVDESRIQKAHTSSKGSAALLETNGFSIFSLIFHPLYQDRFEFQSLPDDVSQD